jgi:hypothetical protein
VKKALAVIAPLILVYGCGAPPAPEIGVPKAADAHALAYDFSSGQELRYFLRTSYSSRALSDDEKALSVEQEAELSQKVLEVSARGRATISLVIEKLTIVMSAPGQAMVVYDSTERGDLKECPAEMRGIAFLAGKKIELEQAPSGEILGIGGLAAIYRQALEELSSEERQPLERLLRDMSHKPRGLLGLGVLFLPRAVGVGEEWSADRGPFPMLCGQVIYPCKYTLKEFSGDQANIEFRGTRGESEMPTAIGFQPLRTTTVQGMLSFDMNKGIVTSMRGESSSFLHVRGNKELRRKTTWELLPHAERGSEPDTQAPRD